MKNRVNLFDIPENIRENWSKNKDQELGNKNPKIIKASEHGYEQELVQGSSVDRTKVGCESEKSPGTHQFNQTLRERV